MVINMEKNSNSKNKKTDSNNTDRSQLARMSLDEIPTPRADAQEITGVVKESGKVTGYQLENGTMMDKCDAIATAREGGISGVGIASRQGSEYLKSIPDEDESNNLGNLPTV
ncbi:MAG: DUF3892 domain-containing protein [Lachnospiraceae bacterium]|jgi:hypothetical protein|nr:DUF3892 domain-containing protein [Lachnospiraceae bacterium]